jgi:hypothetical protein
MYVLMNINIITMGEKKSNIYYFCQPSHFQAWNILKGRDGRVVECGGLENRCSPSGEPGVRIPLSPQTKLLPSGVRRMGFLFKILTSQARKNEDGS